MEGRTYSITAGARGPGVQLCGDTPCFGAKGKLWLKPPQLKSASKHWAIGKMPPGKDLAASPLLQERQKRLFGS